MRPLLIDLGREFRGGQHQGLLLMQGLRERGHAPELIALRDSLLASRAEEIGVAVHVADPGRRRLTAALQIRKLLRKRRVDLLHANEPHALTAAWLARAHRAVPVLVSWRIALPISQGFISMARYRAAARVIAVSNFVQQSVILSGLPADRVPVIYDGVQIPPQLSAIQRDSARHQLAIPGNAVCIGNVAAFVPEKGHSLLLNAFAKLRAQLPECILLLRGDGPELPMLQALAHQLLIAGAVKFLSPSTEIESMFAAMDIFAFPSHQEPLGSALLAAMAHALPVVAIAGGGVPEVVENEKNGLLVEALDFQNFASAVARLIANREEAASPRRRRAEKTITRNFSANRMADETLCQYEILVTGGKG